MKKMSKGISSLLFVTSYSAIVPIALLVGGVGIGVVPFLMYASIMGTAIILVFMYRNDRLNGLVNAAKDWRNIALLSIVGVLAGAVSMSLLTIGTIRSTPSTAGIIYRTYPLMIAMITPLALRQRVSARQMLALVLGFVGVYIILSGGTLVKIQDSTAVILLLGSAFLTAATTIFVKGRNIDSGLFMVVSNTATVLFFVPVILAFHINASLIPSYATLAALVFIGIVDFGIGGMLYYHTYKLLNPSFVGIGMLSVPFFTVILSFLLLGTPPHAYYFAAAGLLTAGMLVQGRELLGAPERVKTKKTKSNVQLFDVTSAFIENTHPHIYSHIRGGGRALAVKLNSASYQEHYVKDNHGCVIFTNKNPPDSVRDEEIEFIEEIMGAGSDDVVLTVIGDAKAVEQAFADFVLATENQKATPSGL